MNSQERHRIDTRPAKDQCKIFIGPAQDQPRTGTGLAQEWWGYEPPLFGAAPEEAMQLRRLIKSSNESLGPYLFEGSRAEIPGWGVWPLPQKACISLVFG